MSAAADPRAVLLGELRRLDRRCAVQRQRLIAELARRRPYQAVLFRIERRRMLVAVDGITEVLDLPRTISPLPGVARWVIGIASHRGELLPLFDLRGLLFGARDTRPPIGRVLVPRGCRRIFGLLVDEVIGIRDYERLDQDERRDAPDDPLACIVRGIFRDETSVLPVVDLAAVEDLPRFAAAASERMQQP
jgi:chemotaxis signal transduction protein